MVDTIKPGDRVMIVGIFRAQSLRLSKTRRLIKTEFNTFLDVISFNQIQKDKL